MKAHCWKHVWHIPGCWRCEAKEWRRKKDQSAQIDGDDAELRAIFGEPVEGRDFTLPPAQPGPDGADG